MSQCKYGCFWCEPGFTHYFHIFSSLYIAALIGVNMVHHCVGRVVLGVSRVMHSVRMLYIFLNVWICVFIFSHLIVHDAISSLFSLTVFSMNISHYWGLDFECVFIYTDHSSFTWLISPHPSSESFVVVEQ